MIAAFPAGYQIAVADINGDGRLDVVALSIDADRVDWFENPGWQEHPVARTDKNIDLAVRDLNGDGQPVIALASGFYRGAEIQLLRQPTKPNELWERLPIAADPVDHRIRWGDLDGDGQPELIHASILGPGSQGVKAPTPSHLWAFRPPRPLDGKPWEVWKIDESLTVLHGIQVKDIDGDGRDEILTASYEGIHRFDFEGREEASGWRKVQLSAGAPPINDEAGSPRGSSEVATFHLAKDCEVLAAIEPFHGHQTVIYSPGQSGGLWKRQVIDDRLREGHALVVGDLDGDGVDEVIVGWRADGGGLRLYKAVDASGTSFTTLDIDSHMSTECIVMADINGDGKDDLVAVGGQTNQLVWYENRTGQPPSRQ
jgi:hypothetical protein